MLYPVRLKQTGDEITHVFLDAGNQGFVKMDKKLYRFYKLTDPRDNSIRYIGQTIRPLRIRLYEHYYKELEDNTATNPGQRIVWLRELKSIKLSPYIELIEELELSKEEAVIHEIQWIHYYWKLGHPLTNTTYNWKLLRNLIAAGDIEVFNINQWNGINEISHHLYKIHEWGFEWTIPFHRNCIRNILKLGIFSSELCTFTEDIIDNRDLYFQLSKEMNRVQKDS